MIPSGRYTLRHVRNCDFGLWLSGDGVQFRDYFTVHERRNWNASLFHIFIKVNEGEFWVEQEVSRRSNDAAFHAAMLAWTGDRIEPGLRDGEFAVGTNTIIFGAEEPNSLEQIAAYKHFDYQITEAPDPSSTAAPSADLWLRPMPLR